MNRYFITDKTPTWIASGFHYLDLPGGGHVVVMHEPHYDPDPEWQELPHLLDPGTPLHPTHAERLKALPGIDGSETMFQLARKLAAIHSKFHP